MKNIYSILKEFGLEIPQDKKEKFDKLLEENYKTVSELDGVKTKLTAMTEERDKLKTKYDTDIAQRDDDLKKLQKQIEDAGTDAEKLKNTIAELDTLKKTYEEDKNKYESELSKQKYEFAVKEKVNGLKFTSNAAKKSFMADVIAKELKMEGDTLLGFDDFVNKYKEEDAGVFVADDNKDKGEDVKEKPSFSTKSENKEKETKKEETKVKPLIW